MRPLEFVRTLSWPTIVICELFIGTKKTDRFVSLAFECFDVSLSIPVAVEE